LEDFRDLISEKSGLDLGYSVDVVGSRRILDDSVFHDQLIALRYSSEPEDELDRLKQLIEETYLNLPVERRVVITDLRNGAEVSPQDVGNGVTQVIPVVAGVVAPGAPILAVEQPELHLHPAIQCRLADVFVRAVRGGEERLFLLESHSEHLMLRLMRRIRETGEGVSPEAHLTLRPDDLSVVYVEAIPEGVKMTVLPLTDDGDFSRNWPAGFFEDRAAELF
jgi:predicted ATPase